MRQSLPQAVQESYMAATDDLDARTTTREADPTIDVTCSSNDEQQLPSMTDPLQSDAATDSETSAPEQVQMKAVGAKKPWFNPVFFLSVAALAMGVIYFDAWIGPDTRFVAREYAKEEPDRQELIATKIEFRLRRAEMFFHNDEKIYQARLNLAKLQFYRGNYDRAVRLLEIANENVPKASPVSGAFWAQARAYEDKSRYSDAANLIKMWKRKMPPGYDVAFDLVPFYEYSARIYKALGDQENYARSIDLAEKSRYVPRDYWEPLTPNSTSAVMTDALPTEYKQALNAMMKNNLPESERLLKQIVGDSRYGFQGRLRAEVMLPVVLVMQDKFDESNDHFLRAYRSLALLDRDDPFARSSQAVLVHAKLRAARAVGDKRLLKALPTSECSGRMNFEHMAESDEPPLWKTIRAAGGTNLRQ